MNVCLNRNTSMHTCRCQDIQAKHVQSFARVKPNSFESRLLQQADSHDVMYDLYKLVDVACDQRRPNFKAASSRTTPKKASTSGKERMNGSDPPRGKSKRLKSLDLQVGQSTHE